MRALLLSVVALALCGFVACSRKAAEERAQARKDLDEICHAQKNYVETRKLLKTVAAKDLAEERSRYVISHVKTPALRSAWEEASRMPAGQQPAHWSKWAQQVGADDWKCPELASF